MWNEVTKTWAFAPNSAPPETGGPYGWNLASQTWEAAPQDGGTYAWDLAGQTWIAQPTDGKTYRFDPFQHQWVEFTPLA
jgi:hypothetical protein